MLTQFHISSSLVQYTSRHFGTNSPNSAERSQYSAATCVSTMHGLHCKLCSASNFKHTTSLRGISQLLLQPYLSHHAKSVHYRCSISHEPQFACMSQIQSQSQHTSPADAGQQQQIRGLFPGLHNPGVTCKAGNVIVASHIQSSTCICAQF